jgi:dipeptidyl aminopeptidase/acylaminoacyl peptidase
MYLPDQTVITIAELLSDRYPEDLSEIAEQVVYEDPEISEPWDRQSSVSDTFQHNLGKYAWSPDSRYLAFVGQIDGPSSDVYFYDVSMGEIARLTADIHLAGNIQWAPDSDTILFSHLLPGRAVLEIVHLHYVNILDRNINNPKEINPRTGMGWISDNEYLVGWTGDGIPFSGFKVINVESGQSRTLWPGGFYNWKINPEDHNVMLLGTKDITKEAEMREWAIYLIDSNSETEEILAVDSGVEVSTRNVRGLANFYYWDGVESDFLFSHNGMVYSYGIESRLEEVVSYEDAIGINVSPNFRWVWIGGKLFDANLQFTFEYPKGSQAVSYEWGPNSAGFFYRSDDLLHYVSLPDGEITVLEPDPQRACWTIGGEIVWLED